MEHVTKIIFKGMILTGGLALLAWIFAGCATDELVGRPQRAPDEQLTSLENPEGIDLPAIPIAQRGEVDLVEELILHRAMYARYLSVLANYYSEHGYERKAKWARNELNDLKRVKPYRYIEDAEVPVATLQPTESIAEADALYEEGLALMKKGGDDIPVFFNRETMTLALAKFKELVDRYPTSDKIDDAAFQIAEIHKEYGEEKDNTIALQWYQRAIDWNPNLPYPARFQMAVVYDYRLHEREKALEMYQQVLDKEQFNKSNVEWANVRIGQLTTQKTRHSPAEQVTEIRPEPSGTPEPEGESTEASPPPAKVP